MQNAPLTIPAEIYKYLDSLLSEGGVTAVLPDEREKMINELYVQLDRFMALKIADFVPSEKLQEFTQFVEKKPSIEVLQDYIQKVVPNIDDVYLKAFEEFRDMYLHGLEKFEKVSKTE